MSTARAVRAAIEELPRGRPFTIRQFLDLGARKALSRTLSRLVAEGGIMRLTRGVFVRPKTSRYVDGPVMPAPEEVIAMIAHDRGETLQIHGAEALLRFRLSTQVPLAPVFLTDGPGRTIQVVGSAIRLFHTADRRRLQFADELGRAQPCPHSGILAGTT